MQIVAPNLCDRKYLMSGTTRCLGTSKREPEPEYLAHPDHFFLPVVLRIEAYLEILAYFFFTASAWSASDATCACVLSYEDVNDPAI
jgi:hypothetical protein